MRVNNRKLIALAVFVCLLVTICIGACYLTITWMTHSDYSAHDHSGGHDWLHGKLGLTDEERATINAFEGDYHAQRNTLLAQFDAKQAELALVLRSNNEFTDETSTKIHELHMIHGKLQKLSIQHYYDMLNALPSEKQNKLRDLAIGVLSEPE